MQPLDGISVLVTRPLDQNESLARAIEEQGGLAIRAPMIVIEGLNDDSPARRVVAGLKKADIAIFVSKNAAEFGLELVAREGVSLKGKAVFAVGLGTAGQLARLGIDDVQAPTSEFSSEGLLRLDGLDEQHVKGKRIVIFRGVGGREHLAKTLERRGADVAYCECYERRKPDIAIAAELKKNAVKVPDIGLATSMEALDNLVEKIEEEGVDQLFDMQMLVVGSRVAQEVESLGFTHRPMVVENPSDDSILRRLVKWAEEA
ncbi:MAG: uroporphyrinogen-III synthase [Gammaproteobacteria bacterium]